MKKGISPVIATVLLVAMVIVIALIVFLWFREMGEEVVTKFGGTNIQLVCNEVSFDADYTSPTLSIINNGNVPIFKMNAKIYKDGSYSTINLENFDGLNQGGTYTSDISSEIAGAEKIVLIPILLGESEDGKKAYACEEEYGIEILI